LIRDFYLKMSEQVEMEEEDRGSVVTSTNQGEKKRFEVKKVLI
jgi:hypothetical protein